MFSEFSKEHAPLPNGKHISRTMMKRKTRKTPPTKHKGQAGIFGSKRSWMAMGTLASYAAIGANRPALAAIWKAGTAGDGAAATLPLKRFDISAGPLDSAIEAYEKATGLSVKIVLP